MQKGIEPTEEEVKGKKLALTPLTALPEELILFQRVLQLFRGVRTSVFDACQSTRGSRNAWLVGCSCAHRTPCLSTSSSTSLRSRCATFRARTRSSQRWSAEPCLLAVQEHALRSAGVFPAVLEPPPEPEPAAGADGEERQLVPGTHWAIQFDEDGEVRSRLPAQVNVACSPHFAALAQMEYVDTRSGQVVFEMPPEVAAAEKAMMEGGGS